MQFVIDAIQAEAFNPKTLFLIGTYTIGDSSQEANVGIPWSFLWLAIMHLSIFFDNSVDRKGARILRGSQSTGKESLRRISETKVIIMYEIG